MTSGIDFISIQVRDLEAAGKFYEEIVGLTRSESPNEHAIVFGNSPCVFAVRSPFPGVDLDAIPQLGAGVGIWFQSDDVGGLHQRLVDAGVEIVTPPFMGPFGLTLIFRDADGYQITVHS